MSERTAMTASIDPTGVHGWDHPGYQQCRKDRRELSDIVTERGKRIAALEAENAALRGFVAAYDETFVDLEPGATNLAAIAEEHRLRQRLATDHGLPLPEVER